MMNYIKRRLSVDAENESDIDRPPMTMPISSSTRSTSTSTQSVDQFRASHASATAGNNPSAAPNRVKSNVKQSSQSPSAPVSPTRSTLSISAMLSSAKDMISQNTKAVSTPRASNAKYKILLVIDDSTVDWAKYFRGRKINDLEVRVEQAEFKNINLASFSDSGTMIDLIIDRDNTKVMRSFKPDFVLVRQNGKDLSHDWKDLIIGLQYGGVASVNSLHSIYNFRDKPWVFSQLIQLQKKHGSDAFPLINQSYCPDYKEMMRTSFPCVVKIGHAHQGAGKIRVNTPQEFQEIVSIVSMNRQMYATTEPFIVSKHDIQLLKIGEHYKAFTRRSINGANWKCNTGSSMLEQIPVSDKYKFWLDEVASLFGGLDICGVQAVCEASTGREYIIDVCDCGLELLGESQEGDRRLIVDLVWHKMLQELTKTGNVESTQQQTPAKPDTLSASSSFGNSVSRNESFNSISSTNQRTTNINRTPNSSSNTGLNKPMGAPAKPQPPVSLPKPIQPATNLNNSSQVSLSKTPERSLANNSSSGKSEDNEDTMNNLRKTFAGIFGNAI